MGNRSSALRRLRPGQSQPQQPSSAVPTQAAPPAPTNRAVVVQEPKVARVVEVPIPKLPAGDYLLVETRAVGLNPTDWKHVEMAEIMGCVGGVGGCDYAGIVEEVGPEVAGEFKKGDRICGPVSGSNAMRKEDGAFAEHIIVKGGLQIKIPDNISDEEAATLGIAITTVGQSLYQTLKLPLPTSPAPSPFPIFIYGGSTGMGLFGIQYAKLSGLTVVTTSSPQNFEYLKSLGADVVFDYHSPTLVEDVRKVTDGKLKHIWDCHSAGDSAALCAKAMSDEGGQYAALLYGGDAAIKAVNPKIETAVTLFYTVFGEKYFFGGPQEPVPENYEFGKTFWELSRGLLAEGKVKPIRVDKNRGGSGLEGVLKGLDDLKNGKHSAQKLAYTL